MSSKLCALLSATFFERGYDHVIELVHQRDDDGRRRLASLDVFVYDEQGKELAAFAEDPHQETIDLGRRLAGVGGPGGRAMVLFDARYDERVFPYRPHHYGYLHRQGSAAASLYYAVSAVLGGVPDRIGATALNNFETYVFRAQPFREQYSLLLGNVARFSAAQAEITLFYERARTSQRVTLEPKAHAEVRLPAEHDGERLRRVEVHGVFRLASYVVGRRADGGDLALFDHLFTYFK
jgi:hypothetical protein